jgi:hypothetical protein
MHIWETSWILAGFLALAGVSHAQEIAPDALMHIKKIEDGKDSAKKGQKKKSGNQPAPTQNDPAKSKRSITLDESVVIDGERPAPGVQFIDSKEERMRRAMEGLLQDTTAGRGLSTSVSRPVTLQKGAPFTLVSISIQGMAQDTTKRELSRQLDGLSICWRKNAQSAQVQPRLYINDKGRVRRVKILDIHPAKAAFQKCVTAQVRALSFSAPAAGSGKIEFTLRWKATAPPPGHQTKKPRSSN